MQNQYNDDRERRRDERGFDEREVTGGQGHGWAYDRSQAGASRDWEYERNRSGSQSGMAGQNDTYRQGGIDSRGQAGASRDWEYERNRPGSQGGMAGQNDMYSPAGMAGSGYDREMGGQPNWASDDAWRVPGPHTGRGPQGYRRSDERIKEDVCERLTQHGQIDASGMQIDVKDCEVTLRGSVSDRRTKRMAEDVAEGVAGVRDVRNELRVGQDQGGLQQREAGSGNRS